MRSSARFTFRSRKIRVSRIREIISLPDFNDFMSYKRYGREAVERGRSVGEDFWGCGWITGEKTGCWKNGTSFARITKREPARSRDEARTGWKKDGKKGERERDERHERESWRNLAHSKWLKDRGNWILAFDRAASGLLIERLVSLHNVRRSFSRFFQSLSIRSPHSLPLSSQSFKQPLFAALTLVPSNNSLIISI